MAKKRGAGGEPVKLGGITVGRQKRQQRQLQEGEHRNVTFMGKKIGEKDHKNQLKLGQNTNKRGGKRGKTKQAGKRR
jgi:hypothetical protein